MGNCLTKKPKVYEQKAYEPKVHEPFEHKPIYNLTQDFEPVDDIKVSREEFMTVLSQFEILFPKATHSDTKRFKQLKDLMAARHIENKSFVEALGKQVYAIFPEVEALKESRDNWLIKSINKLKLFENEVKIEETAFYYFEYQQDSDKIPEDYKNYPMQYYISFLLHDVDHDILKIFKEKAEVDNFVRECYNVDKVMVPIFLSSEHQEKNYDKGLSDSQWLEIFLGKNDILKHLYFKERMKLVFRVLNKDIRNRLLIGLVFYQNPKRTRKYYEMVLHDTLYGIGSTYSFRE